MRDYTPRRFDPAARTLAIDFAVHDAGPATQWALDSAPGDTIEIGGPRGSLVVSPTFDWWLLIGDETALPAIGRRIEELPAGVRAISVVVVSSEGEQQRFDTAARINRPGFTGRSTGPTIPRRSLRRSTRSSCRPATASYGSLPKRAWRAPCAIM